MSKKSASISTLPPPAEKDLTGPTESSNWVIPKRLLTGAYPADYWRPTNTPHNIRNLLKSGVTLIVSLVEPYIDSIAPYVNQAKDIAKREFNRELKFERFPIEDLSEGDEDSLLEFIPKMAEIIKKGNEIVYVHCFSGHGRSGIVISLLLSALYNLDGEEALRLTQHCHSFRKYHSDWESPETSEQCRQVVKIARILNKQID